MGQSQTKQVKRPTRKDGKIRFAVVGQSGVGKSAFINAVRGLRDDDVGAAEVSLVDTTREPREYPHPSNPMIRFIDLPSIGTPNYPDLRTFSEKVDLEDYDTFLLLTAQRFTQNDLQLAEKVKSIGKSFFLIRTKIDLDCRTAERERKFNEENMLKEIREDYMRNAKCFLSSENEIFLISNYDPNRWDFERLITAINDALPVG